MRLRLLLTGDELMAGDIIDSNSAMVATRLADLGWRIERKVTVGDTLTLLCEQIDTLCEGADVLLINGGLGPTVDDLTAEALARVTGTDLTEHPQAMSHLRHWCESRGYTLNSSNRKQAQLPRHCDIINNSHGSAVGIQLQHRDCLILATPGVPSELRGMLEEEILPLLQQRFTAEKYRVRRLGVFGLGESNIQQLISDHLDDWPASITLGFRASMPVLEVKLSAGENVDDATLSVWSERVSTLLADHYLGELPTSLPLALSNTLRHQGLSLCTAESCTGGLIASQITSIAGVSDVFVGGVVSYSNQLKHALLDVSEQSLLNYGAVSREVAVQMAAGALDKTGADCVIAVTGIAGPGGGSDDKPVGTVWIAWGKRESLHAARFALPFSRQGVQMWTTALALDLLRRHCSGLPPFAAMAQRYLVASDLG